MKARVRIAVYLIGAFSAIATARAAEQVVLESNNARYTAGQTFDLSTVISLDEREFVLLATEDGRILRISGPYTGVATDAPDAPSDSEESNVRRAIRQLLGAGPAEAGGLGGVRGGSEARELLADTRPDPWLLHTEITGDQCVVRDTPVRLWREQAGPPASAEVTDVAARESAPVRWRTDETSAKWPLAAQPLDDHVYLVRPAGELRSTAIRVHTLAPELTDKGLTTAAWLAARGCTAQARLVLGATAAVTR